MKLATCLPSIYRLSAVSLPKFGALLTIRRVSGRNEDRPIPLLPADADPAVNPQAIAAVSNVCDSFILLIDHKPSDPVHSGNIRRSGIPQRRSPVLALVDDGALKHLLDEWTAIKGCEIFQLLTGANKPCRNPKLVLDRDHDARLCHYRRA